MNRFRVCRTPALAGLFWVLIASCSLALGSVADLRWCPGTRDCLLWSASDGAALYNVYRGASAQLPAVLDITTDSCTLGSFVETTTGTMPDVPPSAGEMRWYLVGAADDAGTESTGEATAGPRSVDSDGSCFPASRLVLNEIDYDQVGSDGAEFVEVNNPGPEALDLSGVVLILVNGGTQSEYARFNLSDGAAVLPAGGYLVVGAPGLQAQLPPGTPFVPFGSTTNNIQNGAPDGVALFDTASGTLIDALSYEGSITAAEFAGVASLFSLVEGNAATAADSNSVTGALGRFPDGQDTGDAASDWFFGSFPTPGSANAIP